MPLAPWHASSGLRLLHVGEEHKKQGRLGHPRGEACRSLKPSTHQRRVEANTQEHLPKSANTLVPESSSLPIDQLDHRFGNDRELRSTCNKIMRILSFQHRELDN